MWMRLNRQGTSITIFMHTDTEEMTHSTWIDLFVWFQSKSSNSCIHYTHRCYSGQIKHVFCPVLVLMQANNSPQNVCNEQTYKRNDTHTNKITNLTILRIANGCYYEWKMVCFVYWEWLEVDTQLLQNHLVFYSCNGRILEIHVHHGQTF